MSFQSFFRLPAVVALLGGEAGQSYQTVADAYDDAHDALSAVAVSAGVPVDLAPVYASAAILDAWVGAV